MSELNFRFGVVTEVKDPLKFVIKFKIEGWIEGAVAYPLVVKDQPDVGDPVIIYVIESKFGYNFLYEKLKLKDFIRHQIMSQEVNLYQDKVHIHAGENANAILSNDGTVSINAGDSATAVINSGGTITITTGSTKIEMKDGDIKVSTGGNYVDIANSDINIKASNVTVEGSNIDIKGGNITVTGSQFKTNGGNASPSGMGGFCAIPVCPVTGAVHRGNVIMGP